MSDTPIIDAAMNTDIASLALPLVFISAFTGLMANWVECSPRHWYPEQWATRSRAAVFYSVGFQCSGDNYNSAWPSVDGVCFSADEAYAISYRWLVDHPRDGAPR